MELLDRDKISTFLAQNNSIDYFSDSCIIYIIKAMALYLWGRALSFLIRLKNG
ncbi:MAG: hypothetical protein ACI3W6_06570 [Clostridia bacterium]